MTSLDKLPDAIKFYGPKGDDKSAYDIVWWLQLGPFGSIEFSDGIYYGPGLHELGTTSNRMYVTLQDPGPVAFVELFETAMETSCSAADGLTNLDAIRNAIWGRLSSGAGPANPTRKPVNGFNLSDNAPLSYWTFTEADQPNHGSLRQLMKSTRGNCSAWSQFFFAMNAYHGVPLTLTKVTPNEGSNHKILVQEYQSFGTPATIGGATWWSMANQMTSLPGKAGQGNPDPKSDFVAHCVNENPGNGEIFDASYGLRYSTTFDYENGAIWGVWHFGSPPSGPTLGMCRPQSPAAGDLTFAKFYPNP